MQLYGAENVNTTIAIVATDAPLTKIQCHRLAVTAHDGLARAIVPCHTPLDGDLVFAVSTGIGEVDMTELQVISSAACRLPLSRNRPRCIQRDTRAR